MMRLGQWTILLAPIMVLALTTGLLVLSTNNQAWGERDSGATAGSGPPEIGATGTSGDLPQQSPGIIGTPIGELLSSGPPDELTELVARRVQLVINVEQAMNDVAFWTGSPPDDLLVVLDRDTRSRVEQQMGRPSDAPFGTLSGGEYITVSGVIEPVPYPEAMFSWGLTRRDAALLEERGVYIRIDRVVSTAPHVQRRLTDGQVDEWGRETAPPPGDEVETRVPPPKP